MWEVELGPGRALWPTGCAPLSVLPNTGNVATLKESSSPCGAVPETVTPVILALPQNPSHCTNLSISYRSPNATAKGHYFRRVIGPGGKIFVSSIDPVLLPLPCDPTATPQGAFLSPLSQVAHPCPAAMSNERQKIKSKSKTNVFLDRPICSQPTFTAKVLGRAPSRCCPLQRLASTRLAQKYFKQKRVERVPHARGHHPRPLGAADPAPAPQVGPGTLEAPPILTSRRGGSSAFICLSFHWCLSPPRVGKAPSLSRPPSRDHCALLRRGFINIGCMKA